MWMTSFSAVVMCDVVGCVCSGLVFVGSRCVCCCVGVCVVVCVGVGACASVLVAGVLVR